MSILGARLRQHYKGVTWRNPFFSFVINIISVFDGISLKLNNLGELPPYKHRVKSRGLANQFGGRIFNKQSLQWVDILKELSSLNKNSHVLEVGCGCGWAALPISSIIKDGAGSYSGIDIDKVSIDYLKNRELFADRNMDFKWIDVYSSQYNPTGKLSGAEYKFPHDDDKFDIVFLTSVFTHMLPEDVENYFREIGRVLKKDGMLVATFFLTDNGWRGASLEFPYEHGECRVHQLSVLERAVAFHSSTIGKYAENAGLTFSKSPILGNWRDVKANGDAKDSDFGQDIVVLTKT